MAHTWKDGEIITSALLNDLEARADKAGTPGPQGEAGTNGKSITAISLTVNTDGKVTGGSATLDDDTTLTIAVTQAAE